MVALIVVLALTNLVTLGALVLAVRRSSSSDLPADTMEVLVAQRPAGLSGRDRRLITVELLNPIELAGARGGRMASIAGTLAPGLTRRFVYDQTLRVLRQELSDKDVLADVRLHTLRAVPKPTEAPKPTDSPADPPPDVLDGRVVEQVEPLDL